MPDEEMLRLGDKVDTLIMELHDLSETLKVTLEKISSKADHNRQSIEHNKQSVDHIKETLWGAQGMILRFERLQTEASVAKWTARVAIGAMIVAMVKDLF